MNMYERESVTLNRDCPAVRIPTGEKLLVPEGTEVTIAQALGGSFTVFIGGNLVRIAGQNADALGLEPIPLPQLPENASDEDIENLIWEQMKTCYDPEIPINIVDLGLIYECQMRNADDGKQIHIKMTLTAPGCGMGEILADDVKSKIELVPAVTSVDVELVFDPPWNQMMMTDEARLKTGLY